MKIQSHVNLTSYVHIYNKNVHGIQSQQTNTVLKYKCTKNVDIYFCNNQRKYYENKTNKKYTVNSLEFVQLIFVVWGGGGGGFYFRGYVNLWIPCQGLAPGN